MLSKITSFTQGNFWQNPVVHTIVTALMFIIPLVITQNNLDAVTVGSVLRGISQWLETRK